MHKLNKRLKKLETSYTGKSFILSLFDDFNMIAFYLQMEKYGLNTNQQGQVILIDSNSRGFLAVLTYNPNKLQYFKDRLNECS
ncbi:MAG: hypothetical protein QM504_17880 [Pseudomonadota bacterium]